MSLKFPYLPVMAAGLAACACTVPVAAALDAGSDARLARVVPARGVPIYECRERKDAQSTEWVFVAPDAELLDTRGHVIGRHGAGPYWQSNDGSRVTAPSRRAPTRPSPGPSRGC
jgi:hypothetical protein